MPIKKEFHPPTHDQVTLEIYRYSLYANANVIKFSLIQNCQDLHNLFAIWCAKTKIEIKIEYLSLLVTDTEVLGMMESRQSSL